MRKTSASSLEREALARRDRDDALGAEVRPEELGLYEAEMRGDDQPVDLLVRDVGEREDGPVALVLVRGGAHLDAAHDAVGAGRGGDLEGLAPAGIDLGGGGKVQRRVVTGDLDGLDGEGPAAGQADEKHRRQEKESEQPAGTLHVRHERRRH